MTSEQSPPPRAKAEAKISVACRRNDQRLLMTMTGTEQLKFSLRRVSVELFLSVARFACIFAAAFLPAAVLDHFLGNRVAWLHVAFTVYMIMMTYALIIWRIIIIPIAELRYPSLITANEKGFAFGWPGRQYSAKTATIPWKAIRKVDATEYKYNGVKVNGLDLTLVPSNMPFWLVVGYWSGFLSSLWRSWFPIVPVLRINLDAIPSEYEKQQLINFLRANAPENSFGPNFLQLSGGVQMPSYTELWLDRMSDAQGTRVLPAGTKLADDRYEIEGKLTSGGQGTLYIARCTDLCDTKTLQVDQKVVMKEFVLPLGGGHQARERALTHIKKEVALLQELDSPQVIRLFDWFATEHRAFLIFEFIDGHSLQEKIENDGPMPEAAAVELGLQMCDMLQLLHSKNPPVVHRDFTPANLMLSTDGRLKLIDFNVAQQLDSDAGRTVVGKHAYIPPEQFKGRATVHSDIYALGASLCFLLTGEDPEPISQSRPRRVNPLIAQEVDDAVAALTVTDLKKRVQSAHEARALLLEAQNSAAEVRQRSAVDQQSDIDQHAAVATAPANDESD